MRGYVILAVVRASIVTLVVSALWAPRPAVASTKHTEPSAKKPFAYDTSGIVSVGADPASVSGPAVLQFQGVNGAVFDPKSGQTINLGQFVVVPSSVASGQATTYSGTPFELQIETPEFNKTNTVALLDKLFPSLGKQLSLKTVIENSLLLKGHLDGTVGANGQANVTATVDSIKLGSLDPQSKDQVTHYTFPIRFSQLKLPSSWVMGASTTTPASTLTSTVVAPAPAAEMLTVASTPALTTPTPTPEPSTIVFFATVLGGLVFGRHRFQAR